MSNELDELQRRVFKLEQRLGVSEERITSGFKDVAAQISALKYVDSTSHTDDHATHAQAAFKITDGAVWASTLKQLRDEYGNYRIVPAGEEGCIDSTFDEVTIQVETFE